LGLALAVAPGDLCHLDELLVADVFYWHLQSQGEKVGLLLNDEPLFLRIFNHAQGDQILDQPSGVATLQLPQNDSRSSPKFSPKIGFYSSIRIITALPRIMGKRLISEMAFFISDSIDFFVRILTFPSAFLTGTREAVAP